MPLYCQFKVNQDSYVVDLRVRYVNRGPTMETLLKFRPILVAALALILSNGSALGQTGRVEGVVRSAQTGNPITRAVVTIVGTDFRSWTNDSGRYAIDSVPFGCHSVRAKAIGFETVTIGEHIVWSPFPDDSGVSRKLELPPVLPPVTTNVSFALEPSVLTIGEEVWEHGSTWYRYTNAFDRQDFPEAQSACDELGEYPETYTSAICQLWMLTTGHRQPDIDAAWELADWMDSKAPGDYWYHEARLLVGGVIALAGLADSANAVMVNARPDRLSDHGGALLRIEAIMRILAGETGEALDLLWAYQAFDGRSYSFEHKFEYDGELHWFWRPIADHPRFVALRDPSEQAPTCKPR